MSRNSREEALKSPHIQDLTHVRNVSLKLILIKKSWFIGRFSSSSIYWRRALESLSQNCVFEPKFLKSIINFHFIIKKLHSVMINGLSHIISHTLLDIFLVSMLCLTCFPFYFDIFSSLVFPVVTSCPCVFPSAVTACNTLICVTCVLLSASLQCI